MQHAAAAAAAYAASCAYQPACCMAVWASLWLEACRSNGAVLAAASCLVIDTSHFGHHPTASTQVQAAVRISTSGSDCTHIRGITGPVITFKTPKMTCHTKEAVLTSVHTPPHTSQMPLVVTATRADMFLLARTAAHRWVSAAATLIYAAGWVD